MEDEALYHVFIEFVDAVSRITGKGLGFISSFYGVYDIFAKRELNSSGISVSCCRRCSFCCNQVILVTRPELDLMIFEARKLAKKKLKRLRGRCANSAKLWEQYITEKGRPRKNPAFLFQLEVPSIPMGFMGVEDNLALWNVGRSADAVLADWFKAGACPFLNEDGYCDVYFARPLACRALLSIGRCKENLEPAGQFNLFLAGLAEVLLFSRLRAEGARGRTPIPNWLAVNVKI